jgi:hypothetical protein
MARKNPRHWWSNCDIVGKKVRVKDGPWVEVVDVLGNSAYETWYKLADGTKAHSEDVTEVEGEARKNPGPDVHMARAREQLARAKETKEPVRKAQRIGAAMQEAYWVMSDEGPHREEASKLHREALALRDEMTRKNPAEDEEFEVVMKDSVLLKQLEKVVRDIKRSARVRESQGFLIKVKDKHIKRVAKALREGKPIKEGDIAYAYDELLDWLGVESSRDTSEAAHKLSTVLDEIDAAAEAS